MFVIKFKCGYYLLTLPNFITADLKFAKEFYFKIKAEEMILKLNKENSGNLSWLEDVEIIDKQLIERTLILG